MKTAKHFIDLLIKLNDPVMFMGICKVLGVQIYDARKVGSDGKPPMRSTEDLICDVIDHFAFAPSKRQHEIIKILKEAIKEQNNGGNTKYSENQITSNHEKV